MVEKEAKRIYLIKRLCVELQEQVTKTGCLSKELKQANQQLLEVGHQSLPYSWTVIECPLRSPKRRKKNVTAIADMGFLRDELTQYKVGEEKHWETRKKEFHKSSEFYELLGARFSFLFDSGFMGVVK